MFRSSPPLLAAALLVCASAPPVAALRINEIRIDNPGVDTDEYFELAGNAGESLDGLTYVVIGDGAAGSGVVESVTSLDGLSLKADGRLSVHKSGTTATCGTYDEEMSLNFENSDNVTHMLVRNFSGSDGDDLDTNDDGVLDSTPWTQVVDCIALIETIGFGDEVYCTTHLGPDVTQVPNHAFFCGSDGWVIGTFDPVCSQDTPGDANTDCPVSVDGSTWGSVKAGYRR